MRLILLCAKEAAGKIFYAGDLTDFVTPPLPLLRLVFRRRQLNNNKISGSLPKEWSTMSNVIDMWVEENNLTILVLTHAIQMVYRYYQTWRFTLEIAHVFCHFDNTLLGKCICI
jgi:hypothetical protein